MDIILHVTNTNTLLQIIWSLGMGFLTAFLIIPFIIKWAIEKNLVDQPNARKVHTTAIPTLGGIGILAGCAVGCLPFLFANFSLEIACFLSALALLLGMAIVDDLREIPASKKLILQIGAALLICYGGIRITSLGGFLGIEEIALSTQYIITTLFIVGFMNAFNFIDGIDGLAGGIGAINALVLGVLFLLAGGTTYGLLLLALAGGIIAFLYYNFNPAKIFMGDTGSLTIGCILAVMGIKLLQFEAVTPMLSNSFVLLMGILLLPIFDIIRISAYRIYNGTSPFHPDKNHVHHLLLKTGLNHKKTALTLYLVNIILIISAFFIKDILSVTQSFILLSVLGVLLMELVDVKNFFKVRNDLKTTDQKFRHLIKENRFLLKS